MKFVLLFIFIIFCSFTLYSQKEEYKVKGQVIEEESGTPIAGVIIHIPERHKYLGTSNQKGEFEITLEGGRKVINFTLLGYTPTVVEVDVRSITGYLSIELESSPIEIKDVNVIATRPEPIGARKFKPEQANRYAGSLGDPARMVRSFAGVQALNDGRNDIIIRGNSPLGLQWRIDGFEIPNPNHHGGMGLTGSAVTLLNTNLLSNSDFYLGGWEANLSNAISGIFDLNMRGPNDIKDQSYWFQTGWNGFEAGTEGNFDKNNKTSYLVDYRYSFLDVIEKLGLSMDFVPAYQDFTFKTTTQINEKHALEVLGIWGDSDMLIEGIDEYPTMPEKINTGSTTILAGVTHQFKIKKNESITSKLSYVNSDVYSEVIDNNKPLWRENSKEGKYSFNSEYRLRLKASQVFTAGVIYDLYDINYNEWSDVDDTGFREISDEEGYLSFIRGFAQYQKYIANKIKATIGLSSSYLTLNGSYAIEPRFSFKYRFNSAESLTLAGGCYSQMQARPIYFTRDNDGVETNRDLGFTKNVQAILSYNWAFHAKWNLKAEVYYQYLYNIPVVNDPNSTLSTLNLGADYYLPRLDSLINKGKGYNYGLEVTVERYFQNHFYMLANGSLYSSKYSTGFNKTKYSTTFNGNYSFNLTGGYEWIFKKGNALLFDLKGSFAGGQRYTPLDRDASIAAGKEILDYTKTNTEQLSSYLRIDFKITYRVNAPKCIYDFSIDLQNLTNHQNPYFVDYNFTASDVEQIAYNQQSFMPLFTFKIIW